MTVPEWSFWCSRFPDEINECCIMSTFPAMSCQEQVKFDEVIVMFALYYTNTLVLVTFL